MQTLWTESALLPAGWAKDVRIVVDDDSRIAKAAGNKARGLAILLPAPVNAHSHAFQRVMAGLTERRGPDASDSFWT